MATAVRWKRVGRWEGGYVRRSSSGRRIYVIERWHHGQRVHLSTGCSTLEGARAELARFEADPMGYRPGTHSAGAVLMTDELVLEYREHQLAEGLTREWADEVARCLADWSEVLINKDLRTLNLHRDLMPALDGWKTQRPHRIKSIKGLFRWLRERKGLVERAKDATLDLRVPQARPEKLKRRKVVAPEDVAAVLKHLPDVTRDVLHLLTATSWHVSEVRRFAEGGEIVQPMNADGVLAVLITRHKSGDLTKTPIIYEEHLAAARRLRERGSLPKRMTLARHMKAARDAAGVPYFGLGQMRHSVISWSVSDGADLQTASEFAHHRSKTTTARWYLDLDVPKAVIPIRRLTKT